ncbi:MAG: DUF4189 domain-containing protein [Rhizobiaceae bacterium]
MLGLNLRGGLLAAGILLIAGHGPASAALDTPFECAAPEGTYFVGYETGNSEHVFVSAAFAPPRQEEQLEFALRVAPSGSGFRFANDFAEFSGKGHDAMLRIQGRNVPCRPVAANAPAGGAANAPKGAMLDTPGQSLGGKVRSGPGMNFAQVGSLTEGARIRIHANAGVHFNGYDWFEIVAGNVRGFQWGGIMCSEGRLVPGIFQQCGAQASAPAQPGWMALAVDGQGAIGHGAAADLASAQGLALQYCGNSNCRVVDATQNRCHAVAEFARNGYWYGYSSASDARTAETAALAHCAAGAGQNACTIRYSYCQ